MPESALVYDLSPQDVATLIGAHVKSVRTWADSGELASIRTPGGWRRFCRGDVERFIESRRSAPTEVSA